MGGGGWVGGWWVGGGWLGRRKKKARPGQAPWTIVNILKRRSRRWSERRWRRRSRVTGSQGARGRG